MSSGIRSRDAARAATRSRPERTCGLELVRAELEARPGDGLERAQLDLLEHAPLVFDPGCTLPWQELPTNDVERDPSWPPHLGPGAASDGPLRPVNGLGGSLDVHPCVGKHEPYVPPPACDHIGAESLAQLGDQRAQSRVHQGRRLHRPDRVDECSPRDHAVSIERQVGEGEPPLATGKLSVHPPAVDSGDELPAELNSRTVIRQGSPKVAATSPQANRVIVRLSTRRRFECPS